MSNAYRYNLFGLRVHSEIALPELFEAPASASADVTIRLASVPATLGRAPGTHALPGGVLMVVEDIAAYWIAAGREILVEPCPVAPEANVRLFLLGSVMGLVLHQRHMLALHANAIELGGKAVAFLGASGEGKSTLAAWFHDKGYRLLADDVCAIRFDGDGEPLACPGLPRMRLWRQTLELTGRDAANHPRSYEGDDKYDKFDVSITQDAAASRPLPLGAIYQLSRATTFDIRPLEGVAAVEALFSNTYRGHLVDGAKPREAHWRSAVRLAQTVPMFLLGREWDLSKMEQQNSALLEHALHHIANAEPVRGRFHLADGD